MLDSKWNEVFGEKVPVYAGGERAADFYEAGYGIKHSESGGNISKMALILNTSAEEFGAYLDLLEKSGFVRTFEGTLEKVKSYMYESDGVRLYVYYQTGESKARVIYENTSDSISDFSYSYEPKQGDTSLLYGYGVIMSVGGLHANNCGMVQVIKLADNSLFIIDGGRGDQFDEAAGEGFLDFCREITGTPKGEKVRVSCWYLTHNHGDHYMGLLGVFKTRTEQFTIERMAFNLLAHSSDPGSSSESKRVLDFMNETYPDCKFLKLHTGMKFRLANLDAEVLFAHEDLANELGAFGAGDKNNASLVVRFTVEGVRYLSLGDTSTKAERTIVLNITEEEMRADVIQAAHHTWNQLHNIYDFAAAKYAIIPQSKGGAHRTLGIHALAATKKIQLYADPENCFYSGSKTTGLLLKDGKVTVADERDIIFGTPDKEWKYVYEGVDMSTVKDYSIEE